MNDASGAEQLPPPTTMKEAAARDPLGSAFVSYIRDVQFLRHSRIPYVIDYPGHLADAGDLHPALHHELTQATPHDLELSLRVFDLSLGRTHREKAISQRVRALRAAVSNHKDIGEHHPPSELALLGYGFDPRNIAKITDEDKAEYQEEVKEYLPEDVRPQSDDPQELQEALTAFTDSLLVPGVADENPDRRERYVSALEAIIRERAEALGIDIPDVTVNVKYPEPGEHFFFTFSPGASTLSAKFKKDPRQNLTPHVALRIFAHEIGHSLHFETMYDDAQRNLHTENAVYAALGPQAISEGIAENIPRILFPDADSYFQAIKRVYEEMGQPFNEAHIRHIAEYSYRPNVDVTRLTLGERLQWDSALTWERDVQEYGKDEAERRFVENYQKTFLTSKSSAQNRFYFMYGTGAYAFSYAYYRALVARELQDAPDKVAKLRELCHWLPTADELPDDIF